MTDLDALRSPLTFLQNRLQDLPHRDVLHTEEAWWKTEGVAISDAIDRAGTPWLRMFDRLGKHVDEMRVSILLRSHPTGRQTAAFAA